MIAVVAVLVVARHGSNLQRLFRGEELGIDPRAHRPPPHDTPDTADGEAESA